MSLESLIEPVDPSFNHQAAAGTTEPYAAEPAAPETAADQAVVGDIPAQRRGLQLRPALLAQLSRAGPEPSVVVLTGGRGVGKTQLAAAYARARLASGWRLIAWVNARDRGNLLAGLTAAAEAVVLPGDPGPADAAQALRTWLEADGSRCLLVFDQAADLSLLRPVLPSAGAAKVLVIAAAEAAEGLGTRVPVAVFSDEEALALLDGRTGRSDEAGALSVAAELGHLPLTLDLAAAVLAGRLDYAAYLAKLRALPVEDYLVQHEEREEQPYPPGAAQAVLLSLQAARAADPVGVSAGVLTVMAMLSPAAVRRDLLRTVGQSGTLLGGGRRVAAAMVDQALERLDERSLLGFSLDGEAVSMHGLVARVLRDRLTRQERLATACGVAAATLETSAEALTQPRDPGAVREVVGQVAALLENAGELAYKADEELATPLTRLRFRTLYYLIELDDSTAAIALGEALTADLERMHGLDHPDTLRARISLASAYHAAGQNAAAIPLILQTLADRERLLGAHHPSTLATRNNLASAHRAAGRPAEAIPLLEQNLAACERLLGVDHPRTEASRHSLDLARREAEPAD